MATLILGGIGRAVGGPIGGIIGSLVGSSVDRAVLGNGGASREVGRISNLAVQSSAYGEPIPVITGRMRAAGNLIWTSGIKESSSRSGGKRSGGATTRYSYSASFAVVLAGQCIDRVARIWADGKLIRNADGSFVSPVTMRLARGSEGQLVDPLIAAAEGAGRAPAYRGLAYALFEDLPLADYGNRIPNLTFEIVADASDTCDFGSAMHGLGQGTIAVAGDFPAISGYFAGRAGSLFTALEPLVAITNAHMDSKGGLTLRGRGGPVAMVAAGDCDASGTGSDRARERRKRSGADQRADSVEVGFYDASRDYQPGLQRVRRGTGAVIDQHDIAAAMLPAQAKTLAAQLLVQGETGRLTATLRLPWRHLPLRPGALISVSGDATTWRVREARFVGWVVELDVERASVAVAPLVDADGGRALAFDNRAAGPTHLTVLDLPPLPGDLPAVPRLWIAATGASSAWRHAGISASGDGGASYAPLGVAENALVDGSALTILPDGPADRWDRFSTVDVDLRHDGMWLESRDEASVLAGANLAIIGDELIQFATAEALGPGRFRLSTLLRGRRGTEVAVAMHGGGETFLMLDPQALLAFDPPLEAVGRPYLFRAAGPGDDGFVAVARVAGGAALRPLSPAHLRLGVEAGDIRVQWRRRSRAGFGWPDFVDAALGEAAESYQVVVSLDGHIVRSVSVDAPVFLYTAAMRTADGGGTRLGVAVAQHSAAIGPGAPAFAELVLNRA